MAHKQPRDTPYPFLDRSSNFSLMPPLSKTDKIITAASESCLFRSVTACVAGNYRLETPNFYKTSLTTL